APRRHGSRRLGGALEAPAGALDLRLPAVARLHHPLEAQEVALDAAVERAAALAAPLTDPFRLLLDADVDPRVVGGEAVEGDDAGVHGALARAPGDALVRPLLDDLGVELARDPGELHAPVQMMIVHLADLLDAFH